MRRFVIIWTTEAGDRLTYEVVTDKEDEVAKVLAGLLCGKWKWFGYQGDQIRIEENTNKR